MIENPNTESFTISDTTIVGMDIPAGSYDFICLSGNGYVELSQVEDKKWEELLEEGMELRLVPSEIIESEEYGTFDRTK